MASYSNKSSTTMSDAELQKMVKSFRVSDLHSLLSYAGRNKGGKKFDLQSRALELIKLRSASIEMKIRELHMQRYQHNQRHVSDPQDLYPMGNMNESLSGGPYGPPSAHQGPVGMGMDYVHSMNRQMMKGTPQMNMMPAYAVFPDVKFKDLPFYEVLSELMRPIGLIPLMTERIHERDFVFYLSPQQIMDIEQNPDVQVQLRFCLLETSCEQEDEFPSSVCLKVNDKFANLPNVIPTNKPGIETKRPRRPVDITNVTNLSATKANHVTVSWASSYGIPYVVAVYLVRKHSASLLIRSLKANGVRNPDHTTAMIKEKLCQDRDSETATMSLRGSLICPLGKIKMKLPCRALTCTHLQCFDATLYVLMNEQIPKWICPVCDKQAAFKSLAIDGLFLDIVSKAPSECTEVQFHEDGSWTPVIPLIKPAEVTDATIDASPKEVKPKKNVEVFTLDSDSDTEDSWPVIPPKKKASVRPVGGISPVLLDSPENTQPLDEAPSLSFDPHAPSTSKTNISAPASGTVEEPINLDSEKRKPKKDANTNISSRDSSCDDRTAEKEDIAALLADIEALHTKPRFADVTLKLNDLEFPAHKVILSSRSKVFEAMFEHDMKENRQDTVDLVDMEVTTVKDMLCYIYCGKLRQMSPEEALNLYVAADRYDLPGLVLRCREIVLSGLSIDNISEISVVADLHNDQLLLGAVRALLFDKMKEVFKTDKWMIFAKENPVLSLNLIHSSVLNN